MECKNLRNKIYKRPPSYMVEIQRTRDSKQGLETRRYRVDHFDILAVCLFNQTQKWDYVFIRSKDLERWQEHPEYLEKMQRVPMTIEGLWKKDLIEILNSFEGWNLLMIPIMIYDDAEPKHANLMPSLSICWRRFCHHLLISSCAFIGWFIRRNDDTACLIDDEDIEFWAL